MGIYRLKPAFKDYLWGGNRIRERFNKDTDIEPLSESWELSTHPDGNSLIEVNGNDIELEKFIENEGKEILGENSKKFRDFPILVKLIDAAQSLSVQVHPDEEYAREHEDQHGKTEMWIVLDCDDDSFIYYGLKEKVSPEEFKKAVDEHKLEDLLNKVKVKKGDVFLIPPGTIHAIGEGCLINEIQQNSNVTYRIYDYGRRDPNGNLRELHLDKAMDVALLEPPETDFDFEGHTGLSNSFVVDRFKVEKIPVHRTVDKNSFSYIFIPEGKGIISSDEEEINIKTGDSLFIAAGTGDITLNGDIDVIEVKIP